MKEYIRDNNIYESPVLHFLLEHSLLAKFLKRVQAQGHERRIRDIDTGLTWDNTPEGHTYWSKLQDKYVSNFQIYRDMEDETQVLRLYNLMPYVEGGDMDDLLWIEPPTLAKKAIPATQYLEIV